MKPQKFKKKQTLSEMAISKNLQATKFEVFELQ